MRQNKWSPRSFSFSVSFRMPFLVHKYGFHHRFRLGRFPGHIHQTHNAVLSISALKKYQLPFISEWELNIAQIDISKIHWWNNVVLYLGPIEVTVKTVISSWHRPSLIAIKVSPITQWSIKICAKSRWLTIKFDINCQSRNQRLQSI